MKQFTLLLAVHGWSYSREQSYDDGSNNYVSSNQVTFNCFWDGGDDSEFNINAHRFHEAVTLAISIGDPKTLSDPLDLEFVGTHRSIRAVLGSAQHFPKRVDVDTGLETAESIGAFLFVSESTFLELLQHRNELRRFHVTVLGSKVELDWDGNPSWEYDSDRDNCLYIVGYSYTAGTRARKSGATGEDKDS